MGGGGPGCSLFVLVVTCRCLWRDLLSLVTCFATYDDALLLKKKSSKKTLMAFGELLGIAQVTKARVNDLSRRSLKALTRVQFNRHRLNQRYLALLA